MNRLRAFLALPYTQLALVLAATAVTMAAGYLLGFTEWIAHIVQVRTPGNDLADLGPGLLVLSTGLGLMTLQRWRESDVERKRADAALYELANSQERYSALAGNTEDIVCFAAPDGRILDCNEAAVIRYGYTIDELKSMTVYDLRAPGSTQPMSVDLTREPGDSTRFDAVHARKDGTLIELSMSVQRVLIGADEIVMSVGRDVTARREAERELRSSEERYRSLTDLSPSPVIVYNTGRVIIFANQALLDLVRAQVPSQVIGHNVQEFIHPDSHADAANGRARLERDGSTPFHYMRLVRVDGTPVAVQVATSRTLFDGKDAFHGVIQDVSQLKDVADNLLRTTEGTISAMARLAESRDPYTSGHQARVSSMATRIAVRLGLPEARRDAIRLAGVVHDIGKMSVPTEILSKPGALTGPEFSLIKEHAERGYEILRTIDFPWPIAEIVREHHERLDGSGYPRGIADGAICIEARVLAVADVVEAISSHRPYRPALGLDFAIDVIRQGRGTLFDEACVDAAVELAAEGTLLDDDGGVTGTAARGTLVLA